MLWVDKSVSGKDIKDTWFVEKLPEGDDVSADS